MKFPYHVFHNGVSYAPFEEVPIDGDELKGAVAEETPIDTELPDEEEAVEEAPKVKYTKNAINRMPIAELRKLGVAEHIKNAEFISGAEIKKQLIDKFGL